jgi:hypothetical protein
MGTAGMSGSAGAAGPGVDAATDAHDGGGFLSQCVAGEGTLVGTLDGQNVTAQLDLTYAGQSFTLPYTFDLPNATLPSYSGKVHLEYTTPIGLDQPVPITGTIVMPAGAPHAGETICVGAGMFEYQSLPADSSLRTGVLFSLEDLSAGPSCPGTPLTGRMDACLR